MELVQTGHSSSSCTPPELLPLGYAREAVAARRVPKPRAAASTSVGAASGQETHSTLPTSMARPPTAGQGHGQQAPVGWRLGGAGSGALWRGGVRCARRGCRGVVVYNCAGQRGGTAIFRLGKVR
jgi:hypothetical protein